jgi:hypothetical protein
MSIESVDPQRDKQFFYYLKKLAVDLSESQARLEEYERRATEPVAVSPPAGPKRLSRRQMAGGYFFAYQASPRRDRAGRAGSGRARCPQGARDRGEHTSVFGHFRHV